MKNEEIANKNKMFNGKNVLLNRNNKKNNYINQ